MRLRRPPVPVIRRGRAYARDCLGYVGTAAVLLPIGVPIALRIEDAGTARWVSLTTSLVPPVLATLWAAAAESGPKRSTWGKRREGLRVIRRRGADAGDAMTSFVTADEGVAADVGVSANGADPRTQVTPRTPGTPSTPGISMPRALLRNAVKIALPWQLGHIVAVGAAFGDFDTLQPVTMTATALTYAVLIALVSSVALGSGRGFHDRLAGTRVIDVRGM